MKFDVKDAKYIAFQPKKEEILYSYSNENLSDLEYGHNNISKALLNFPSTLPEYLSFCKDTLLNITSKMDSPIVSLNPFESAGSFNVQQSSIYRIMVEGILLQLCYEKNYAVFYPKQQSLKKIFNTKKLLNIINDDNYPFAPSWWSNIPKKYKELALIIIANKKLDDAENE